MAIIEVQHVTKEFMLGQLHSLKLSLEHTLSRLRGKRAEKRKPFRALDDVDFKIEQGEVVGIIGHNGAGKSTLLKLLSRITVPTKGKIIVRGKVAPLIEVGAGLVGEMTGRENIYLNAAILGVSKREIRKKLDEIVEFAELEQFIDTPLKRYSSGMHVRLGFAIATSVEADILIVDEVLAVGDLAFQRKCFDRMENLIKETGRTVLIVGHNIRQIERICSRVILLATGRILVDGEPAAACNTYFDMANAKILANSEAAGLAFHKGIETSGEIEVNDIVIKCDDTPGTEDLVPMHGNMRVMVEFQCREEVPRPEIVLGVHTTDFVYLISSSSAALAERPALSPGKSWFELSWPNIPLYPGTYSLRLGFLDQYRRLMWYGDNVKRFRVVTGNIDVTKLPDVGLIDIPTNWRFGGRPQSIKSPYCQDTSLELTG